MSVEAFVGKAHGDLAEVQRLLEADPTLVNAAHDWGGGDWETALGAASHMGRRDIASVTLRAKSSRSTASALPAGTFTSSATRMITESMRRISSLSRPAA